MSLSCDDGVTCTVHRSAVHKARQAARCSACRADILPGHYYRRIFLVYEGEAETIRRCGSCDLTWQHLYKLCQEHNNDHRNRGDNLYPDESLDCGLKYEEEWGDLPDEIAALPLMSAAERGALLAPKESA